MFSPYDDAITRTHKASEQLEEQREARRQREMQGPPPTDTVGEALAELDCALVWDLPPRTPTDEMAMAHVRRAAAILRRWQP
jgi:hypothetical protein